MSRLSARFASLRRAGEKALIPYVTAGDPAGSATVDAALAMADAGVDALELGLPFSDPLADGPSIQASTQRALDRGITPDSVLEMAAQIRTARPDLPIVVMTYYNPVLRYGMERYARRAVEAGIDAHIVTDLTPEEAGPWKECSTEAGLDTVFLLAPTSTPERIQAVASLSTGFVYCVSRTGVTGAREDVPPDLVQSVAAIRRTTDVPVCVGFGVSRPEHVRQICAFADGAVVGSALVDCLAAAGEAGAAQAALQFVAPLKEATRR